MGEGEGVIFVATSQPLAEKSHVLLTPTQSRSLLQNGRSNVAIAVLLLMERSVFFTACQKATIRSLEALGLGKGEGGKGNVWLKESLFFCAKSRQTESVMQAALCLHLHNEFWLHRFAMECIKRPAWSHSGRWWGREAGRCKNKEEAVSVAG